MLVQVYRHTFWQFRNENPRTRVGEPLPYGLPGFNSGVLLLDLNRMRQSSLYNSLLEPAAISRLCNQMHFKGHLGDQDFFTLLGMRYEQLFYILPCQWNRQLCRWWADNGYKDVFESYNRCDGDIMIYHGNCNTPIPWEPCLPKFILLLSCLLLSYCHFVSVCGSAVVTQIFVIFHLLYRNWDNILQRAV